MQQWPSSTAQRSTSDRSRPFGTAPVATVTTVVADDRPVVRLGLHAAAAGAEGCEVTAAATIGKVVEAVQAQRPGLLVIAVREND
ncbi:MAG: pyrimidine deaminase RibD-like protein, partial [Glaciecola sp.]